ncbi:MAG: DsbE family thiol:disulfide interchange protein [Proteobacteria bacterium]|nr:DsbE family thiol:disulfide interchange protein [Pseudomonadota bacterium]
MNKIPLLLFGLLAAFFVVFLMRAKVTSVAAVESAMVGRKVPTFKFQEKFKGGENFSSSDLHGRPSVVNVFASQCLKCRIEQGILEEISQDENVPVYGLDYKDTPDQLASWLKTYGNPYEAVGVDHDGRVAIDWGVNSVPETFVVDAEGVIRYRHVGVMTDEVYQNVVKPMLAEMKQ